MRDLIDSILIGGCASYLPFWIWDSRADMIKAMEPEIKKALPQVITPERFTRMALSALNTTPKLAECSQMSFLGALMNAAQLGLEPNTPLGQAYLIPYRNKGKLECQFQIHLNHPLTSFILANLWPNIVLTKYLTASIL